MKFVVVFAMILISGSSFKADIVADFDLTLEFYLDSGAYTEAYVFADDIVRYVATHISGYDGFNTRIVERLKGFKQAGNNYNQIVKRINAMVKILKDNITSDVIIARYNTTRSGFVNTIRPQIVAFSQLSNAAQRDTCWNSQSSNRLINGTIATGGNSIQNGLYSGRVYLHNPFDGLQVTFEADLVKLKRAFGKCNFKRSCILQSVNI